MNFLPKTLAVTGKAAATLYLNGVISDFFA